MSKEKFEAILPIITAEVISRIMEKYNLGEDQAIMAFHKSKLYELLEREDTKVWQYSSEMLLELFERERNGELILPEV